MTVPARIVYCIISGKPIEYRGYGRPPKYHPDVKAKIERDRRAARYEAKQAAAGKTVKRRKAA